MGAAEVIVFVIFFAFTWMVLSFIFVAREIRIWNGGVCARNGLPWDHLNPGKKGPQIYKAGNETMRFSWTRKVDE